jgi:hypothetical protein
MRRHRFDPISLVFGAIFTATGLVFLFGNVDLSRVPPAWSWPIPLMIVGALIILLSIKRERADVPPAPAWEPAPPAFSTSDDEAATVKLPDER